jgi:Palmitoyl protein thioesterase
MLWDLVREDNFLGIPYPKEESNIRGFIERCNHPPVRNLITWGAQHNGIGILPLRREGTNYGS